MTKKDAAIKVIRDLHGDTSQPIESTLDQMEDVRDLADELVQTMRDEIDLQNAIN